MIYHRCGILTKNQGIVGSNEPSGRHGDRAGRRDQRRERYPPHANRFRLGRL